MQILDDFADILAAEGVLEGRHDTAASLRNGREDLRIGGGRSARKKPALKDPLEHRRLFPDRQFFSVVASAAVHLK